MAKLLMPKAELERRASDVTLTDEQLLKIGLFAKLKRKPSLDKFPGAIVLRRFRKGEVIFRQGEAGWTAFYILTSEDVLAVEGQAAKPEAAPAAALQPDELRMTRTRLSQLKQALADADELRTVAVVHLAVTRRSEEQEGFWKRLRKRALGTAAPRRAQPQYIPIDGPRDINYQTLQSKLFEGELFGEMSCLYRSPRSATIVATRDCYMLEMLRNILDQLQKDPSYKAQTDELYKKRLFDLQLRQFSLFSLLDDRQYAQMCEMLELVSFEAGQLIFDEFERSDSMYIIRSGLVRVIKKASALLFIDNIRSWKHLGAALCEGETEPATARGKVWQLLSERGRELARKAGTEAQLPAAERQELLDALNDLLRKRDFADAKEFQEILASSAFTERAEEFPANKKRKDWSDQDLRRFQRLLLEKVFDQIIRTYRRRVGPDAVLSYCARGDIIGEMGLLKSKTRMASCVAHGHPLEDGQGKDSGRVELVRIPLVELERLIQVCPGVQDFLEKLMAARMKQNQKLLSTPMWDESNQVMLSRNFQELGLIQGQRLMLIDLDRCTRCDECVKACVNTHADGRSRLFLDGPRFDKFLVPTTCRSCLDPVCMIGCPVGSIHRGNNGEIEIEDWCIGCGLCANNCPYGSIQMHDIGVIPLSARGWRLLPTAAVKSDKWQQSSFNDSNWVLADAPFFYDRQIRELLTTHTGGSDSAASGKDKSVCFRIDFRLGGHLLKDGGQFKLELTSSDAAASVWVNGNEIKPEKPKAGKREYALPQKAAAAAGAEPTPPVQFLVPGRNVLAVKATPGAKSDDVFFNLRLDSLHKPTGMGDAAEDVTEKLVAERAVVCDLCSSSFGQVPACVNACPHDAAMRVDARFEFPMK
jgi:Fe-S-cluster-containing hydrogenase component 2/CRP-like cAMP-binding protein